MKKHTLGRYVNVSRIKRGPVKALTMMLALMFVVSIFSVTAPLAAQASTAAPPNQAPPPFTAGNATTNPIQVTFVGGGVPGAATRSGNFGDLRNGYQIGNGAGQLPPLTVRVTNHSGRDLNSVRIELTGGNHTDFRINGTQQVITLPTIPATGANNFREFTVQPRPGITVQPGTTLPRSTTVSVSTLEVDPAGNRSFGVAFRVLPSFRISASSEPLPFGRMSLPNPHNLAITEAHGVGASPGNFSWVNPALQQVGARQIQVRFEPTGHNQFSRIPITQAVTFNVVPARNADIIVPQVAPIRIGQTFGDALRGGGTPGGTWDWIDQNGNVINNQTPASVGGQFPRLRFTPTGGAQSPNFLLTNGSTELDQAGGGRIQATVANNVVTTVAIRVDVQVAQVSVRARDFEVVVGGTLPAAPPAGAWDVNGLIGNDSLRANPTLSWNPNVRVDLSRPGVFPNAIRIAGALQPTGANYEQGAAGIQHIYGWVRVVAQLSTDTATGTGPTTTLSPGWHQVDGNWVYAQTGGRLATGWLNQGGAWYYLDSNGRMQTGWITYQNIWYFLRPSGAMAVGWVSDSGSWFMLGSSGAMVTGWVQDGGTWYFLESSGRMATGWVNVGGTYYYMRADGSMVTGVQTIGGVRHRFNASGAWLGRA